MFVGKLALLRTKKELKMEDNNTTKIQKKENKLKSK
jgi:hypothetical protein